jgi:molybdate transport system regulatory protein
MVGQTDVRANRKLHGKRGPVRLTPRVKVWFEADGRYGFGLGICEILGAVDRTGSIKVAARNLAKSYRYVWTRIKEAEAALGEKLVETQVGGQGIRRSFLTDHAKQLVVDFLAIRSRMTKFIHEEFARRFR